MVMSSNKETKEDMSRRVSATNLLIELWQWTTKPSASIIEVLAMIFICNLLLVTQNYWNLLWLVALLVVSMLCGTFEWVAVKKKDRIIGEIK